MLVRSAGRLARVARHVGRSALILAASAGLSIALTQGVAAAEPLLPPPQNESLSDPTEAVTQPSEAVIATTEAAGDALAPAVDAALPVLEPTTDTLEPVSDTILAIAEPIADSLAPVIAPIVDVSAPVTEQVLPILEPVQVIAPLLAPLADASAPVTDRVVASLEPVEAVVAPITRTQRVDPRISRPTDPVMDPQLERRPSADRIAAVPGAFIPAAPAPPAVIPLAEPAADVRPLSGAPDRPLTASSTPISSAGHGGVDWTPMAVFGTLLLLGLVSRALITTALLRPPTTALFVPVPPG